MRTHRAISKLFRKWMTLFWLRNFTLIAVGIVAVFSLDDRFLRPALILLMVVMSGIYWFWKDWPTIPGIFRLLNGKFPQLEFSTTLLSQENLTGLASIQQQKVMQKIRQIEGSVRFPVRWIPVWIAGSIYTVTIALQWLETNPPEEVTQPVLIQEVEPVVRQEPVPISLDGMDIRIDPPVYTGLSSVHSKNDIQMPEGSRVTWQFSFSDKPESAYLHLAGGDSLPIVQDDAIKIIRLAGLDQGFYWVSHFDGLAEQRTPYYKIEVIPDEPPRLSITGIPQYQEISFSAEAALTFGALAEDDHGLTDAYIVATVTKGEGESVKFREEKLSFEQAVAGKVFQESMTLSAARFGLEPGNELYFYLEAADNRQPNGQLSRTETYFFVLEDTTDVEFSLVGSLGVDLMPEYFRSQRQIIIDTEKLLEEKAAIPAAAFKSRSNELGFDQKTLRLKYGQFLGEEAESGIAIENETEADHTGHDHENHQEEPREEVLRRFGHDHDHEAEEGEADEQPEDTEALMAEITHSHDDEETATFYTVSLKTKLKAALSEMWDAELYLRLYEPEKSLPYQHAALKLIKEIKNHARIYVQRIGFDPPPIAEDGKRLSGDLDDLYAQEFRESPADPKKFPAIRKALTLLGDRSEFPGPASQEFRSILRKAGNELAGEAIRYPSRYLKELSLMSRLMTMEYFDEAAVQELSRLQGVLLALIEVPEPGPLPKRLSSHPLTQQVRQKLSIQPGTRP